MKSVSFVAHLSHSQKNINVSALAESLFCFSIISISTPQLPSFSIL